MATVFLAMAGCASQTISAAPPKTVVDFPIVGPQPSAPLDDRDDVATPEPSPDMEPDPVDQPEQTPPLLFAPGDIDDGVRELQHRLRQLEWLTGEITDNYDERTVTAVEGFQAKRDLPTLGYVDQATWERLVDMSRTPTHEEMHNIRVAGPAILEEGDDSEAVRDLQARLKQIGWFNRQVTGYFGPVTVESVRGFQAKRELPETGEIDQDTLDALHDMTRKPTAEELADQPPPPEKETSAWDARCLTGRAVCVSKQKRRLAWIVDGTVQFTADVRFGSELTPTRNGSFNVGWKSRNHVSSIYHTPMPYALFFSGGQAVHYSADFAANGYNGASHGCVNLRDKGVAERLFDATRAGDPVIVY